MRGNHTVSFTEARMKIMKWCAYQERCHSETKDKLRQWGLKEIEADQIMADLISEGFINEERYAITYAGGKFRMLGWGKEKIRRMLELKQVSDYCIRKALTSISHEQSLNTLSEILKKKKNKIKETEPYKMKVILFRYAISRGYDQIQTEEVLNNIFNH